MGAKQSPLWGVFCGLATLLGAWTDSQGFLTVGGSVSAVTTVGAAVLPYVLFCGALYFGGILAAQGFKRVRYHWQDGPSVDKFRALAPRLSMARSRLQRHYMNRGTSVGDQPVVSDASALMVEFSGLLGQLLELGVPVVDAKRYMEGTARGLRFQMSYVSALAELASEGHLRRARSRILVRTIWQSVDIGEAEETNG